MGFQIAYVPVGVGTFHLESAQAQFDASVRLLNELSDDVVCPDGMLLTIEALTGFLKDLHPDLIIFQNITFANAAYASEVLKRFSAPIVLWTLREPVIDGGRLRLNSLTGAYSAANAIHAFRDGEFEYVYGGPAEAEVRRELSAAVDAAKVRYDLQHLKMAAIGQTPQGFGFGRALDAELMSVFGVTLESIEARELINQAKALTVEDCQAEAEEAGRTLVGLDQTPDRNRTDFLRLYKAYKDYVVNNGIQALSSRCWPDFFTDFGTPVCGVLSLLNANGIAASCESDVYGALSMYIGQAFSGQAAFFGDPVSLDEDEGTITFWHCGMAACSLARTDTGAQVGVHPNRKIGPVMDFGCRASDEATIFRVGRKKDGSFRFFIAEGRILDKPKQFCGTSIVVQTDTPAKDVVHQSVKAGWEPHYVVLYAAAADRLEKLGHMLGVEVCRF